jgi:hypothetical protein
MLRTEEEDDEVITKISAIIQQEQQCSFWKKMNYFTGKKKTWIEISIQVKGKGGVILEHSTQERVKRTIFSEIYNKQYTMMGEAPICIGELFNKFGHTANTPASRAVLDGMYVAPQDSYMATWDLFDEITSILRRIPEDSVPSPPLSGSNSGKSSMRKHHHLSLRYTLDFT